VKRYWLSAALAVLLVGGSQGFSAEKTKAPVFGALETMTAEAVQAKAQAWLKEVGKTDAPSQERFTAIWAQKERTILDRLADTFSLGDAEAAKLLAEARDLNAPAPEAVPDLFKNDKLPAFYRANLGMAYARALANRRVHEEALAVMRLFRAEQTIDPATFLFFKAVSEHSLLNRKDATASISRLLEDAIAIAPERYKTVSALMLLDMQTWKEKDLSSVARKMSNVERRLELAKGGPETQKLQKDIVLRLDELIKELENKRKPPPPGDGSGDGQCPNGGGCPNGQQPGSGQGPPKGNNPSSPATESGIANQGGTGNVDPTKFKKLVENWVSMPARERARALQELTQGMSQRHREAIEAYFRNINDVARRP
jgi:hypothetical protein